MPDPRALGQRAPMLWVLLPFAAGIAAAQRFAVPGGAGLWAVGTGLGAAALLWAGHRRPTPWALGLMLTLVAAGGLRYEMGRARLPAWEHLPQREAALTILVERVFSPGMYPGRVSLLGRVEQAEPHLADLVGQSIQVSARTPDPETAARVVRDTRIAVTGQLELLPRRGGVDGFTDYLVDAGVNFRLSRGRTVGPAQATPIIAVLREAVRARAGAALSVGLEARPELAGALRAMLLGERHGLDDHQENLYLRAGALHLFAISGLHIGVIAAVLHGVLRGVRLRPTAAWVIGSLILAAYVDLIGRTPSSVRAWLMVTAVHAALVLRAPRSALAAIAASAVAVLLLNPMQLFAAGFQMSYGIVFALLLYGLPLGEWAEDRLRLWRDLPEASLTWLHRAVRAAWIWWLKLAALAVAASLIGLISGVAFFGWFTPLSILANLILVPVASYAIVGGFLALVCGLAGVTPWAELFNHAAALVLVGMQALLEGGVTGTAMARAATFRAPWLGEAALLLVLAVMLHGYAQGWRGRLAWWWPVAATVVVLVSGVRLD